MASARSVTVGDSNVGVHVLVRLLRFGCGSLTLQLRAYWIIAGFASVGHSLVSEAHDQSP